MASSGVMLGSVSTCFMLRLTMDNRKMANDIAEHGSVYTPDVIYGVLEKYRNCVVEILLQSRRVKINGLGTFSTLIRRR